MFLVTDVQEATERESVIVTAGDQEDTDRAEAADMMTGVPEEVAVAAAAVADGAINSILSLFGYIGFLRKIFVL